jgi:hypothetical protein
VRNYRKENEREGGAFSARENQFEWARTLTGKKRERAGRTAQNHYSEYFESAVVTVIMALFGMTFIVQAVKCPRFHAKHHHGWRSLAREQFVFAPGRVSSSCRSVIFDARHHRF